MEFEISVTEHLDHDRTRLDKGKKKPENNNCDLNYNYLTQYKQKQENLTKMMGHEQLIMHTERDVQRYDSNTMVDANFSFGFD